MKRLYWKIFFAFWLVMVLVLATNLAVTWVQANRFHNIEDNAEPISELTAGAIRAYEEDGVAGFWRWRDRLKHKAHLKVILVDASGKDVTGRPLPRFFRSLVENGAAGKTATKDREWLPDSEDSLFSRKPFKRHGPPLLWPGRGQSGERYHLILLNPKQLSDHLYGQAAVFWRVGISILVVALFAMLLSHYLVKPIRALQQASRNLAKGDLDTRVRASIGRRRDELGELGDDFDSMADRLQSLILDQRRMLRDVSHELRTPLARLRIALELARKRGGAEGELNRIERESERIDELIGDILHLVRLNSAMDNNPVTPLPLRPLLQALQEDANLVDDRVRLQGDTEVQVLGDAKLLRRALENIVQNALKYSDQSVDIHVSRPSGSDSQAGGETGNWLQISVNDQGPGVEEAQLEQLFEPFFRSDEARQRDTGGYGLGLAIAARSIHAQQGRIYARNLKPSGLSVVIELPEADA